MDLPAFLLSVTKLSLLFPLHVINDKNLPSFWGRNPQEKDYACSSFLRATSPFSCRNAHWQICILLKLSVSSLPFPRSLEIQHFAQEINFFGSAAAAQGPFLLPQTAPSPPLAQQSSLSTASAPTYCTIGPQRDALHLSNRLRSC